MTIHYYHFIACRMSGGVEIGYRVEVRARDGSVVGWRLVHGALTVSFARGTDRAIDKIIAAFNEVAA